MDRLNLNGWRQPKKGRWKLVMPRLVTPLVEHKPELLTALAAIIMLVLVPKSVIATAVAAKFLVALTSFTGPGIGVGTLPDDHTGDPLRSAMQKLNSGYSKTYFAGSPLFNPSGTATTEQILNAAIIAAAAGGGTILLVPLSMIPYNASLVTFNTAVRMVREGGDPSVYDVQAYGAAGDGTTDDTAAIQAAASGVLVKGGTLLFPPGKTYITTNASTVLTFSAASNVRIVGYGATVKNTAGSGSVGALVMFTNGLTDVTIEGLTFVQDPTNIPSSFDNMVDISASGAQTITRLRIYKCYFGKTSNKQINIQGNASDVWIEDNVFDSAHVNSNVSVTNSVFAAIFFLWVNGTSSATDVHITRNKFVSQGLFCISMDQTTFPGLGIAYDRVWITDNEFKDCMGGIIFRGDHATITGNVFTNVGINNILTWYTWDAGTSRYFSKVRAAAGQTAAANNTISVLHSPVLFLENSTRTVADRNKFVGVMQAQFNTSADPTHVSPAVVLYDQGSANRFCDNVIDETASTTTLLAAPSIRIAQSLGGETGDLVNGNRWLFTVGGAQPSQSLIRIDDPSNASLNNLSYNRTASTLYNSVPTLAASATPSVLNGTYFSTSGTTTITNFTDGDVGQTITIVATAGITITNNANILLAGAVNFAMAANDTLTLHMFAAGVWTEMGRSVNH